MNSLKLIVFKFVFKLTNFVISMCNLEWEIIIECHKTLFVKNYSDTKISLIYNIIHLFYIS